MEDNQQKGNDMELELCPRNPKKKGNRVKLAITMDRVLYDKIQQLYQKGYSVSHLIDSGMWVYFGRPPLSFENQETNNSTE